MANYVAFTYASNGNRRLNHSNAADSLEIGGALEIKNTLSLTKASGTGLAVTSDATVGGTLGVTGISTLTGLLNANGGIAVDTNKFTVAGDGTGNTVIAGTLDLTGISTLTGLLNANGGIAVDTNKFTVAGDGTGDTVIDGTLNVTGAITGNLTGDVTGNADTATQLNCSPQGVITGATGVYASVNVTGDRPAVNGWAGYKINNKAAFMAHSNNSYGLHHDTHGWLIYRDSATGDGVLCANGVEKFRTRSAGCKVTGTLEVTSTITGNLSGNSTTTSQTTFGRITVNSNLGSTPYWVGAYTAGIGWNASNGAGELSLCSARHSATSGGIKSYITANGHGGNVATTIINSNGSGGWTPSDDRLKTNEVIITDALATLNKLRPQRYTKQMGYPVTETGFIAQELWYDAPELRHLVNLGRDANPADNIPTSADPTVDPDYSSWGTEMAELRMDGLMGYAVRAIQELDTALTAEKTKVATLETTVADLLARVVALESA